MPAYICGPLKELPLKNQLRAQAFYSRIADLCMEVTGIRAFVPHEHNNPALRGKLTPIEIDKVARKQICERTSLLIVVATAASWDGGIKVEMARWSRVPVVILCAGNTISAEEFSSLLSNPAVEAALSYEDEDDAIQELRRVMVGQLRMQDYDLVGAMD